VAQQALMDLFTIIDNKRNMAWNIVACVNTKQFGTTMGKINVFIVYLEELKH